MSIIDTTLFELETRLPYLDNPGGSQVIFEKYKEFYTKMIAEHEPEYLREMFGRRFARELYDYISLPPEEKTNEFINQLIVDIKKPCSDYVFCCIVRDADSLFVGTSSIKQDFENSINFPTTDRYILIWNRMAKSNREIICDIDRNNIRDYHIHHCHCSEIFHYKNSFGI